MAKKTKPSFIDIHAHAQLVPGIPRHGMKAWISGDALVRRYDELGVEKGVLLPIIGPEYYEPQNNREILDICAAHPDRLIPFCNIHPRAIANSPASDFRDLLAYYKEQGCRGVGEVTANLWFRDPLVQNFLGQVEEAGLPVTIHVVHEIGNNYGLCDEPGLPQLERTLQRFPKLKILGHAPAFWSEVAELETPGERWGYPKHDFKTEGVVPRLMRRYDNLYGDLSAGSGHNALARNPKFAAKFLTEFQDRLLFGMDITQPETRAPLVECLKKLRRTKKISEKVFCKITRNNALKLLGLK